MYSWYTKADVCYIYLSDIPDDMFVGPVDSRLQTSRWFTRGWTLQELIAPENVRFFTNNWKFLGTKTDLESILAIITGVNEGALSGSPLEDFSIAQRMSWASKRVTTRSEDTAYCLMGLFNVNMPLLYGEGGEKAFARLQEEILKSSGDQSLFAWGPVGDISPVYTPGKEGLLAKSPSNFARFGNVVPIQRIHGSGPSSMTNKGVHLSVPIVTHDGWKKLDDGGQHLTPYVSSQFPTSIYTAILDCQFEGNMQGQVGIILTKWGVDDDQYARTRSDPFLIPVRLLPRAIETPIYVKATQRGRVREFWEENAEPSAYFVIPEYCIADLHNYKLIDVFPGDRWNDSDGLFKPTKWALADEGEWTSRAESSDTQPSNLVFSYHCQQCSESPFVVILEYTKFTELFIQITNIVILADEGKALNSISEDYRSSHSKKDTRTAFAVFDKIKIQINIRTTDMLEKRLWLIAVTITDLP